MKRELYNHEMTLGTQAEKTKLYVEDEDWDLMHRICYYKGWTKEYFNTKAMVEYDAYANTAKKAERILLKKSDKVMAEPIRRLGYEVFTERRQDYGWLRWNFVKVVLIAHTFRDAFTEFLHDWRMRQGYLWTYHTGWADREFIRIAKLDF